MPERPFIGIITARAAAAEQRQLLSGILQQAHELGADTAVFSNLYNFEAYYAGTEVENRIYDLVTTPRLDGLILTAESILNPDLQQYIYQKLISRNIPVIVTGAEIPGMNCINNDVTADFADITRHLVEVHQMTEIDFLTGFAHLETSHQRVQGCRNVLEQHGLSLPEEHVIYGDFWMNSGEKLALDYIEGRRRMPQAVLCANDYMAYGICDQLLAHGVPVPEAVTVIGYEYVGERFYHAPILTTYRRNRFAVGKKAVMQLYAAITGTSAQELPVSGEMVCGNSCTCGVDHRQLNIELQQVRQSQYYINLNFRSNFEQQLTVCRSAADYVHVLQEFAYLVRDVKSIFLCLYEDWCSPFAAEAHTENSPMLCYRIISPLKGDDTVQLFLRQELFPGKLTGVVHHEFLYFVPIFFAGRELGYFILQYDQPDSYDTVFGDWLKIAANGLEALRMKNDLHTLLECQNLSEYHDSATGLLNQDGFLHHLYLAQEQAEAGTSCMLMIVRTALFSDDTSIDEKKRKIHMEREGAAVLQQMADKLHGYGARLQDRLFALGAVGSFTASDAEYFADCLRTCLLHAPLYQASCAPDTLIHVCQCLPADETEPEQHMQTLLLSLQKQAQGLAERRSRPNFQQFQTLRCRMFRHPEQEWSAQELCRQFHLSRGHFCALYKDLFQVSFHQDVLQMRISTAKYLLLTTDISLSGIAMQCGYQDGKYFLRQFRQLTGMTPNAFRTRGQSLPHFSAQD